MSAEENYLKNQYLTLHEKKANSVAMILFSNESPEKEKYIFLIQKETGELQTPGGKVIYGDSHSPQILDEEGEKQIYLNAAIRETCEEICGTLNKEDNTYQKLEKLLKDTQPIYVVIPTERQKLGLRPENGPYDTRTHCFYLGTQKLEEMRAFLMGSDTGAVDVTAAYLVPCQLVRESNNCLEVEDRKSKSILGKVQIRSTTITILRHMEGILAQTEEKSLLNQSYSRSGSPAHFQPVKEERDVNDSKTISYNP